MDIKRFSTFMIAALIGIAGVSASAEARCHKSVNVNVGGCGPCCQPVYVQPVYVQQPMYVQPAYAAPVYVPPPAYAVPCQPCYYQAQPAYYNNVSFGVSWR